MKLIVPLEIRIQQAGEKYQDDQLMRDALEVRDLKQELSAPRGKGNSLFAWCALLFLVVATFTPVLMDLVAKL